jgi:hypothetical protein
MKLQHIAAAVALVAAGAANAAVDNIATGNSSLFLIAFDNAGGSYTTTSMFLDLGYNLTDFNTTSGFAGTGQKVVWDFGTNTITANGAAVTADNAWTAAFDKLVANSDAGQIKWTVGAGDSTGSGANANYLVTATANSASQNAANTGSMSATNGMFAGLTTGAGKGTVVSNANGAFTFAAADGVAATSANGYVVATTAFGTNWLGKDVMTNSITTAAQNNLWQLNGLGVNTRVGSYAGTAGNSTSLLNNAGTFTFNTEAKTLTWETATPVPEASSYALALTGVVLAGMAARRRRAA